LVVFLPINRIENIAIAIVVAQVTPNYKVNNVSILLGTGNGKFGAAKNCAVGNIPFSLSVKDLNGDGNLDLSTVNNSGDSVSVLLGDGKGGFAPVKNFAVGNNPDFGTLGDFNNDGLANVVYVNRGSNDVSVLLNNTVVISTTRNDFNNDGKSDILWCR
jgi:hypothetical protein